MESSALLDMLAARAAADDNPAAVEAIARLRTGSDAGPKTTEELLAQLGQGNPLIGLMAKQLAQGGTSRRRESEVIDVESQEVDEEAANVAVSYAADELAEARARLDLVSSEREALRERLDLLADALGACCLCWGQDRQCRACRGRGQSGYAVPDESLFEELILPAVQMLLTCRKRRPVSSSRS